MSSETVWRENTVGWENSKGGSQRHQCACGFEESCKEASALQEAEWGEKLLNFNCANGIITVTCVIGYMGTICAWHIGTAWYISLIHSNQSTVQEDPLNRKWQSTPVFLPGKFHGQGSLVGYSPWGRKKSDATVQLSTAQLTYTALSKTIVPGTLVGTRDSV